MSTFAEKFKKLTFVIQLILPLVAGWLFYNILQISDHSLQHLQGWHSAKSFRPIALMTPQELMTERQVLAEDKLNLSSWNGFNEVFWLHGLNNPNEFSFELELAPKAYIEIGISYNSSPLQGLKWQSLRLSRQERTPSAVLTVSEIGQILSHQSISKKFESDQAISVKITAELLFINGEPAFKFTEPISMSKLFYFRSSWEKVAVDSFELRNAQGRVREDFKPPFSKGFLAMAMLFAGIFYIFLTSAAFYKWPIVIFTVTLLFGYWQFDKHYYRAQYPFMVFNDAETYSKIGNSFSSSFESYRKSFFYYIKYYFLYGDEDEKNLNIRRGLSEWKNFYSRFRSEAYFVPELSFSLPYQSFTKYKPQFLFQITKANGQTDFLHDVEWLFDQQDKKRILFVGTSQTWGGGAQNQNTAFTALYVKQLNQKSNETWVGLNLASPGLIAADFVSWFQALLEIYKPDRIVYNFGNNDSDAQLLKKNLLEMATSSRATKAKQFFILEANSQEHAHSFITLKHDYIKEVAAQVQAPVIDLHSEVRNMESSDPGILWRDYVHFSPLGHFMVSRYLLQTIK